MKKMNERIYIAELMELYKDLLTETQRDILIDHFDYDLSLQEIAEKRGISRSAVGDAIKIASIKLEEYEEAIHLLKKMKEKRELVELLLKEETNPKKIEIIKKIEEL